MITSGNEWQRVTTNDNEWQQITSNEWQRVTTIGTTSDNKWKRVKANDNEWQRVTKSDTTSKNGKFTAKMDDCNSFYNENRYTIQGMNGWY